jgi:type II secretory pathway component HofQ
VEFRSWGKIRLGAAMTSLATTLPGLPPVPAAQAQQPLQPLAITQLDERLDASDLDNLRPLDITLGEPAPIVDLLLLLVRGTRLSIVPDPDITGTFQGELKGVTVRQALEMILQPRGYDYSVQGNLVRVFRRRLETRRYDLNYVITRRTATRTLGTVRSVDEGDLFGDLATGVQTLLSPEGRFNVDKKAAMLQATDYPERLDQIQLYVDAVQNRATRQVQIQAKVIEVVLSTPFENGIDWNQIATRLPAVPAGSVTAGMTIKDYPSLLTALATQGEVNVKSSPTLNTLNNEAVMVRVGTQDVTGGVVLSVTPQISGDGMINMSISPSLTERTGANVSVREADTVVRVHEKETVVITGLMEERVRSEERRVPVIGDVPGLGRLFRSEVSNRRKTDLVILLTPTVITPGMRAARE